MTSRVIFLTNVEQANVDQTCPRQFWYHKFQSMTGLIAKKDELAKELWNATLGDLRDISLMEDISQGAIQEMISEILDHLTPEQLCDVRSMELLYRRLGWLAAYALFIEPGQRSNFMSIPIQEEIVLDRDPLWVTVKPGRVLRNLLTKEVEHREFVPTGVLSTRWRESWEYKIQPHLSQFAVSEDLNMKIDFGRIVGLNTGFTSSLSGHNGQLRHPYVYGYRNVKTGEWTHNFKQPSDTDWREEPVWKYPYSLTDWVLKCGMSTAENQFPLSARIKRDGRMVEEWVQWRLFRERALAMVGETCHDHKDLRNIHFPQNTNACSPIFSPPCSYRDICWAEPMMQDALMKLRFTAAMPLYIKKEEKEEEVVPVSGKTLSEQVEDAMAEYAG